MYDIEIFEKFADVPVFSLSDINQIINNKGYVKKFINRLVKNGKVLKIRRGLYTLKKDPFLVSAFIIKPSYVTSISALSYHRLITQIPNEIFCATTKKDCVIKFGTTINFFHTNYFFGFEKHDSIIVADPEKAIIDSLNIVPISVFEEALDDIDEKKMISYLKRIKKSSIIKRIGYLMEKHGHDYYKEIKRFINYKYIKLDPLLRKYGKRDKKWKLIINIK